MCIKEAKSWTHVLLVIQTWTEIGDLSQKWPSMWNVLYICITEERQIESFILELSRHIWFCFLNEMVSNNSFLFFFFCLLIINEGLAGCWYYIYILAQKQDAITCMYQQKKKLLHVTQFFKDNSSHFLIYNNKLQSKRSTNPCTDIDTWWMTIEDLLSKCEEFPLNCKYY